jgi:Protein of unknown function (DUF4232)
MSAPRGVAVALITLTLSMAACASPRAIDTTTTSVPVTTATSGLVPPLTGPAATAPPTTTAVVTSVPCSSAALRLGVGPPVSEETGEHSLLLTLTNASPAACFLEGYPAMTLDDTGQAPLPFSYDHAGYQTTGPTPQRVALAPQGTAYVMINKYRCDLGDRDTATTLGLVPPGGTTSLTLSITGLRDFSYCGPGDPGSTVDISPVEPTAAATTS